MSTNPQSLAPVTQLPVLNPTPMDLMQSAIEKGVDPDQLEKLMALQERWQANEARRAFSHAMADFQARCPTIMKSKKADRYTYAPLDTVLKTIRPHLGSAGLSVRFSTMMTESTVITAICTVSHRDGHSEVSEFAACVDDKMHVNETQKMGSANSYAKRYALMNALNLVASDEDDDGYSAGTPMITDKQMIELQDHMDVLGVDEAAFFKYLGIKSLDEMPASSWPKAMLAIERKQKAVKK